MSKRIIPKIISILLLGLIAVMAIVMLKWQKSPVHPRSPQTPPSIDYGKLIQMHTDQAHRRDVNAFKSFEMDINRIVKQHEPVLQGAATAASKKTAGYKSCCALIYYMAWDKVKKQNRTDFYLESQIKPIIDPAISKLAQDTNRVLERLESDLKGSTLLLARDLAALGPTDRPLSVATDPSNLNNADFDNSLRNLGFNAAGVGVGVVFDALALSNTTIAVQLWKKIAVIVSRFFGKQIVKVGGSASIAAADGPLPIADVVAFCAVAWTGYDAIKARKEFEKELKVSIDNILNESSNNINTQSVKHANAMLKSYQEMQDNIGTQTFRKLSGVQP